MRTRVRGRTPVRSFCEKHSRPLVLSSSRCCPKLGKFRIAFPAITKPPVWMASASRSIRSEFWRRTCSDSRTEKDSARAAPIARAFRVWIAGDDLRRHRRQRRCLRLHSGMVLAPTPHARQGGGGARPTHWRGTWPSPQPCQGHLLYRGVRIEWGRIGALAGSGFRPRPISGARALQSRHPQSGRAGFDGQGEGHGTTDIDPGRAGVACRHDQCPGLSSVDAASVSRAAARRGKQGSERDEDICRRASGDRGVRRMGQERPLDRQLCGRAIQQPQRFHLRRQFRRRARGAMVAAAGGASRPDIVQKISPNAAPTSSSRRSSSGSAAGRCIGPWW